MKNDITHKLLLNVGIDGTCSLSIPRDNCAVFASNEKYFKMATDSHKHLAVFSHVKDAKINTAAARCLGNVFLVVSMINPEYCFIDFHNFVNANKPSKSNDIGKDCVIHPMASIGNEGMKYVKYGSKSISMKHMGNVVLGNRVVVNSFTSIASATFDSTIIEDDVKIGCNCSIGHNSRIGERTVVIDGAITGGSVKIGKDCYLSLGCLVRNGVSVCDKVFIGMGAVVVNDITEPGMYVGVPAKKIKDWNGDWV